MISSQDLHSDRPCYPEELALIRKAVPKRRDEFITARYCARQALAQRGIHNNPILKGKNRQPLWPEAIVGSITHCTDFCAVAVASTEQFHAIGIDAEPNTPLKEDIRHLIITENELKRMEHHPLPSDLWPKLIFSAKETIFKCYFPLIRQYLDFLEAEINFPSDEQRFTSCVTRSSSTSSSETLIRSTTSTSTLGNSNQTSTHYSSRQFINQRSQHNTELYSGQFEINLLVPTPIKYPALQGLRGRYLVTDQLIHTALALPA